MLRDVMNAVAHFRGWIGNVLRVQSLVDWFPRRASVVSAESARSRDRNKDPVAIRRVQNNRMQAHAACAWLPLRSGSVTAHSRKFVPGLTTVGRAKQRSVFDTGIDGVGIVE